MISNAVFVGYEVQQWVIFKILFLKENYIAIVNKKSAFNSTIFTVLHDEDSRLF